MSGYLVIEKDMKRRMESSIDHLKKELSGLRTGRSTVSLLENISVDAYGSLVPISQVASLAAPEPRMLTVQVWDKSQVQSVEKAIRQSDLGLNPASDGQLIRVPIPPLSEERREELKKVASKYAEESKISLRNIRRDCNDQIKKIEKDGDISKDQHHEYQESIQSSTNLYSKKIDEILLQKQQEIMKV